MKYFGKFCDQFCKSILPVIFEHRKVIIGGYDVHGAYYNWLLKKFVGYGADIIIDEELCVYGVKVYRELFLNDINPKEYIGVVPSDRKYEAMFKKYGIETVVLEDVFGCKQFGFYEWLESKYGCDFVKTINRKDFDYDNRFATNSGVSRQMGLVDVMDALASKMDIDGLKVLDVGCGKGGAIELLSEGDFARVDGIELSKSICDIARKNMEVLGRDVQITNISATEFDRYGDYDILYMYDPFREDVFRKALRRIENNVVCKGKPMMIIYANPYHHKDIIEGGIFELYTTVDTDFFHRDVKIYISKEVR